MKRLGERINRKRESLNMKLSELARKVGISSSALSQIEKAKAFPSVFTLKAIADHLYTSVGELIGENEILTQNPLVKFKDKSFVAKNRSGASLFLLSNHGNGKQMDTFLIEFRKKADAKGILREHPGQAFFFVLKGKLEVVLDEKKFTMEQNDSFYFNAVRPHSVMNTSDDEAQLIWIATPPENG